MNKTFNTVITFGTLMATSFWVALYNESGDKNAAGMYLIISIFPAIILTFINSITLLLTQLFDSPLHKNIFLVATTPLLLLSYTLFWGHFYFNLNYIWALSLVVINGFTVFITDQKQKNTDA